MPGLFGTLNLGARSLQVQQQGIEVAGHNLANVTNPAYARQRVNLATSITLPTPIGPVGTGVDVVAIQQLRDALLDAQVVGETSIRGYLEACQSALQQGQAVLGQRLDRTAAGASGSAAATAVGTEYGVADGLADLFAAFQELSTNPASLAARQTVLAAAANLTGDLRRIAGGLDRLRDTLNQSLQADVAQVNELLGQIANYNKQIVQVETGGKVTANDLRDLRQARLEELAELVNLQTVAQSNGAVDVIISGATLVSGVAVADTLEVYDAGDGHWLVRTRSGGGPLSLTSGRLQGTIETRDGALQSLRTNLDTLAATLIAEVNVVHRAGYSLTGTTGADFFTGTAAADIALNPALAADPALLQASGTAGAAGDNQVALALARLADQPQAGLGNQTFSQRFARLVAELGQELASTNHALSDQDAVETMLQRQRDALSGVSLDEEMTDLIKFQKAFEASARLIATIDEMLNTVLSMKR